MRASDASSFGTATTSGTTEPKRRRRDATQAMPGIRLTTFFVAPVMKTHLFANAAGAPTMVAYEPFSSRDHWQPVCWKVSEVAACGGWLYRIA